MTMQEGANWEQKIPEMCGSDPVLAAALLPLGRATDPWQPSSQDALLAWPMHTRLHTRIAIDFTRVAIASWDETLRGWS